MLNLHKALKTKKASLTKRSSTGIGRPRASRLPSSSRFTSALGAAGASVSAAGTSSAGAGIEIDSVGSESPSAGEGRAWSDAAIGAGAVGMLSLGLGSANESLSYQLFAPRSEERSPAYKVILGPSCGVPGTGAGVCLPEAGTEIDPDLVGVPLSLSDPRPIPNPTLLASFSLNPIDLLTCFKSGLTTLPKI